MDLLSKVSENTEGKADNVFCCQILKATCDSCYDRKRGRDDREGAMRRSLYPLPWGTLGQLAGRLPWFGLRRVEEEDPREAALPKAKLAVVLRACS